MNIREDFFKTKLNEFFKNINCEKEDNENEKCKNDNVRGSK